jgi:hypothetical protein
MDIVPAEGYTQKHTSPSNTNHRERSRKVPTASPAGTVQSMKDLQTEEIWSGRCAVDVYKLRSIKPSLCVVGMENTDRMKVLQTAALPLVRAMRAVFWRSLRQKIALLAAPQTPCLGHGPSKPSGMPFKPLRGSSTTRGA